MKWSLKAKGQTCNEFNKCKYLLGPLVVGQRVRGFFERWCLFTWKENILNLIDNLLKSLENQTLKWHDIS